ncbi:uncharacterized protein LOC142980056 isoform X2 [Anticarsia gemmatalis]|uniref:uncharacterized protein LOC142980056 isoform X1 n=1 Tax=Anticarsia gemmatalis TaxID=129554 RepID=UPI003F76683B
MQNFVNRRSIMFKVNQLLLMLAGISVASCYCPLEDIRSTGKCEFFITCINTIRDVSLPPTCLEATNYPVSVHVTLNEAIDRFDNDVDINFLSTITFLKISANWKESSLALLQYTSRLRFLDLAQTCLERLSGSPFYHLSRLMELNLSHNKLTEIKDLFVFENQPNRLKKLSLAYNAIGDVPGYAFEELSSLTELDLSYNIISDLTEEPFYNLTKLAILKLNNNRIKDLNGALNSLRNLKHLYLRGNEIQNIDDSSLKIIEHLETFDVSLNQLEKIKPIMFSRHWNHFGNHSVCKIILSENQISNIPNATSIEISSRYVRNLDKHSVDIFTELDLSANSIEKIEYNAFQSLIRVISLNLAQNRIVEFIVNPDDLACVKFLNLSSNYISHLYFKSFYRMNNLHNLDLSYNRLDFIPDMTFNNNYNLKLVNMTYNEIEKLDGLHITMFHPEGGVLDLSNNGLYELKVPYGEGMRLVTLILRSNNISDCSLVNLQHQTELQYLDVSKNLITWLDKSSVYLPSSLVRLDLTCNNLHRIGPSSFGSLENLQYLYLGHNHLTEIDYGTFEGLSSLRNLDLSYNRITYLDSKFFMDLKSLQTLSVRSNAMQFLDYKSWYYHKNDLQVYVDNNNLTCEWLRNALADFHNGYSRMEPVVLISSGRVNSVEGIPCMVDDSAALTDRSYNTMTDERLLVVTKKILEALEQQTNFLMYFRHVLVDKPKHVKSSQSSA